MRLFAVTAQSQIKEYLNAILAKTVKRKFKVTSGRLLLSFVYLIVSICQPLGIGQDRGVDVLARSQNGLGASVQPAVTHASSLLISYPKTNYFPEGKTNLLHSDFAAYTSSKGENKNRVEPGWLNAEDSDDVINLVSEGFGSEKLVFVKGEKGTYFLTSPYYHKLAALVSPGENLLPRQNFKRWMGEGAYAEQDLAIGIMPGIPDDILGTDQYHTSLCGVLVISTMVNEDPAYFIWEMYRQFSWAPEMLAHSGYGTYEKDMIAMLKWRGWNIDDPEKNQGNESSCQSSPLRPGDKDTVGREAICDWSTRLSSGFTPVIAANLMVDRKHGVLVSKAYGFSGTANASHWVTVLQMVSSNDGHTYVRIYNPFQNREEWLLWDDMFMAWQAGPDLLRAVFFAKPPQGG